MTIDSLINELKKLGLTHGYLTPVVLKDGSDFKLTMYHWGDEHASLVLEPEEDNE